MGAYYEVRLYDAMGIAQGRIDKFSRLQYVLRENAVGSLVLETPDVSLFALIGVDWRIEVWRSIDGAPAYLEGSGTDGTVFLVVRKSIATGSDGLTLMSLSCVDVKDLLARRFVDYYAGSSQSSKTLPADNMLNAIVRDNLGVNATGLGRDLSTAGLLVVQGDKSIFPSISKAFAWRNVLTVLQEICAYEEDIGNYLGFDIVKNGSGVLEFRTYDVARGVNRTFVSSNNPSVLYLTPDNGSLTEPAVIYDYSREYNYVKAAGEGEGAARLVATALYPSRVTLSPFNRRERFIDARNGGSTTAQLTTEAITELLANRMRTRLTGRVTESAAVRYGRTYRHGDYLLASAFGVLFSARVETVSVTLDVNGETIEALLAGERQDY